VPHGAVRIGDALQLRAIFLRKMPTTEADQFVVITVVTDRGSEQGRGRMVAVLQGSEGRVAPALDASGTPLTELALLPPFTEPEIEPLAREETVDFLRLALAYDFFGPKEVHETIAPTPTHRLIQGKPRKDGGLFAMVRLQPARDRLGRPAGSMSASWSLATRQEVAGHFKLQPHGTGLTLRKLIWVGAIPSWVGGCATQTACVPSLAAT
jgi:hypothetical protein